MIGQVFSAVTGDRRDERMVFTRDDDAQIIFFHSQDCCESVQIEDVVGDLAYLIGSPIVSAEVVSSEDAPAPENADSYTWTFYKFATVKGSVTVRWLGESNGYYSEEVSVRFEAA